MGVGDAKPEPVIMNLTTGVERRLYPLSCIIVAVDIVAMVVERSVRFTRKLRSLVSSNAN
jgi:hypothetical protein